MKALAEVVTVCGVAREDLMLWIERRWVLPLRSGDDWAFSEADVARVRMIAELRQDLDLDDEALPVVLALVDRLYAARRRLRQVLAALAELPTPERDAVLARIEAVTDGEAH